MASQVIIALYSGYASGAPQSEVAKSKSVRKDSSPLVQYKYFGSSAAFLADMNDDGVPELAIGNPCIEDSERAEPRGGEVAVFSGKTGQYLFRIVGNEGSPLFGISMASCPQKDGRYGLIVCSSQGTSELADGRLTFLSGSTLLPLMAWSYPDVHKGESPTVISIDDIDKDGVADLVLGLTAGTRVHSASTGKILTQLPPGRQWLEPSNGLVSSGVFVVGDYDKDGARDIAVVGKDEVSVFSSLGGAALMSIPTDKHYHWARSVCCPGDVDRDGVDDIVIACSGDPADFSNGGHVVAYSGRDKRELWRTNAARTTDRLGWGMCVISTSTGVSDVVVLVNGFGGYGGAWALAGDTGKSVWNLSFEESKTLPGRRIVSAPIRDMDGAQYIALFDSAGIGIGHDTPVEGCDASTPIAPTDSTPCTLLAAMLSSKDGRILWRGPK